MSTFNDTQYQILPYKECKDIYRTTTLGKRIVEGLPNFAMSTQREIDIHKAPPEAIEKFKETAAEMKQDEAIKKTIYNARIYGTGALYIAMYNEEEDKDDFTTKPTFEDAYKYKIKFTVFDPLNISGARVNLDPLSFHFLEVVDIQVNSKKIPKKRIAISHALEPLYLDTRTSLIPYSPPSIFYNMVELLKQYDDAIKSIGDLLYKAGAIIYKYPVKSKLTGVTLDAITASGNILEQKRSGEVISISNDSVIEDFPIANLNGLIDSINKLEDDITKALSDTPVSILFDRNLSNGFSEGDKDKETVISTIESFRENKLTPLYNLTDYYIMLKAWDRAFIDEMRYKYSEYEDKTDNEIFRSWAENFKFKYGNLFPEPESVIQDNNAKKLDNLLKAQQLGANPADLQEELNESEIFKNEMELNPQNMEGNEDDEEMFDYNNINSEIKADSDNNFKEEEHPRDEDGKFTKVSERNETKENKDKENDENDYKVNVSKLPKDLQDIGEKLYSGKFQGGELVSYTNSNGQVKTYDEDEIDEILPKLEASIYKYTCDENNKFTDRQIENIKQLIYNSPTVKIPLYRGVKGTNEILNLKKGDDVPLFDINSFSSEEDKAQCFAKGRTPVIFVIDKPCKALNIQPLSTYYDEEAEYFVGNGYKVDKIENNKDIFGTKGTYITISPKEEIK
ncbi:anti-CBASS protein Acb1 family protein [Brachyspira pilosicoli]